MSSFFQLFVAWGVLLLVLLSFYLMDMVHVLYRQHVGPELPKTYDDGLFGELSGKKLWDAMSGLPQPGVDDQLVANLRPHYEPVLRQHIEQTFMQGFQDVRQGKPGLPGTTRMIPTPRGKLESWLPMHHLATLYQAGGDAAAQNPEERLRLQQTIDQVTSMLYARVQLPLEEPFSRHLLEMLPSSSATEDATQNVSPAQSDHSGVLSLPDAAEPLAEQTAAASTSTLAHEPDQEEQAPVLGLQLDPSKQTVQV